MHSRDVSLFAPIVVVILPVVNRFLCEIHRLTERDDDGRLGLQTPKQTLSIIGRETPGFVEPGVFCCPGLFTLL
jgi:hypothetical protein